MTKLSLSVDIVKTGQMIACKFQFLYEVVMKFYSVETEVLDLATENSKIISPTLPAGEYIYGIGIYAVDFDFCRKRI